MHHAGGCDVGIEASSLDRGAHDDASVRLGDDVGVLCEENAGEEGWGVGWHADGEGLTLVWCYGYGEEVAHPGAIG